MTTKTYDTKKVTFTHLLTYLLYHISIMHVFIQAFHINSESWCDLAICVCVKKTDINSFQITVCVCVTEMERLASEKPLLLFFNDGQNSLGLWKMVKTPYCQCLRISLNHHAIHRVTKTSNPICFYLVRCHFVSVICFNLLLFTQMAPYMKWNRIVVTPYDIVMFSVIFIVCGT